MALPGGVSTFTLHFGPYLDATGAPLYSGLRGQVVPSVTRRHLESGAVIEASPIAFTIAADGTADVEGLAHTGQAALLPVSISYSVEWPGATVDTPTPERKTFAVLPAAGADVDYDLLPSASPSGDGAAPVMPAVLSVNGRTGTVTLDAGDIDDLDPAIRARVAADLVEPTSAIGVAGRAALGSADPVLSDFVYTGGNLTSYKEDGVPIVLTYNADGTVATSKRGDAPAKAYSYTGGNLVGVA